MVVNHAKKRKENIMLHPMTTYTLPKEIHNDRLRQAEQARRVKLAKRVLMSKPKLQDECSLNHREKGTL
jgi:hypothetical protein